MILQKVFNAMDIYTPLEEAKEEIWRRWNDEILRKEVEKFLGEVPEVFKKEPRACLLRQMVSPNYEYYHFLTLIPKINLKPLCLEYLEDIFLTTNKDKAYWGKMAFIDKRQNITRLIYKRVINLVDSEKKKLNSLVTIWGENFSDFHHRLVEQYSQAIELCDASSWYKSKGGKTKEYYHFIMAFFICHGILFENFVTGEREREREREFTHLVVQPAIEKIVKIFGLKPLIVQLITDDVLNERYYPCNLESEVSRCLCQVYH